MRRRSQKDELADAEPENGSRDARLLGDRPTQISFDQGVDLAEASQSRRDERIREGPVPLLKVSGARVEDVLKRLPTAEDRKQNVDSEIPGRTGFRAGAARSVLTQMLNPIDPVVSDGGWNPTDLP